MMTNEVMTQMLALCLLEQECSTCNGRGLVAGIIVLHKCPTCPADKTRRPVGWTGTGRVPLLDPKLVRLPRHVLGCPEYGAAVSDDHEPNPLCRGFEPSCEPWDYVRAAAPFPADVMHDIEVAMTEALVKADKRLSPSLAAFQVVAEALLKEEK